MLKSKLMVACLVIAFAFFSQMNATKAQEAASHNINAIRDAAKEGDPEAEFKLAMSYIQGPRIPGDEAQVEKWLKLSASKNYARAAFMLALCYNFGSNGFKRNENLALQWGERAADLGDSDAMLLLAMIYRYGTTIKHDKEKVLHYTRSAIERHNAQAEGVLAIMYLDTFKENIVSRDYQQALKWGNIALHDGDGMRNGEAALGAIYLFGLGVPQDYSRGMSYLTHAYADGQGSGYAGWWLDKIQQQQNDAIMQRLRKMEAPRQMPTPPNQLGGFDNLGPGVPNLLAPGMPNIPTSNPEATLPLPQNGYQSAGTPESTGVMATLNGEESAGGGYLTCHYITGSGYEFTTTASSCRGEVTVDPESGRAW